MKTRILFNIFLGISILFFPWWASLLFGILLLVVYKAYEVIVWAFFFDTLYGNGIAGFYDIQFVATFLFFILFLLSFVVKKKIIFYQSV